MDAVFYFHFYAPNDGFTPLRSLAFYVDNITTAWDKLDERMGYLEGGIEAQYGEHCALVALTSAQTGTKLIGYSSSDIHGEKRQQVMDVWRTTFVRIAHGCVVSDVYDVTNVGGGAEMSRYVKDAYEHQQAQQLRDRLNAHLTTGSPAAIKKI